MTLGALTSCALSRQWPRGGASISLTYITAERIILRYGGGMSSAKAALESDTKVLAFEARRRHKIRVNTISASPLRSRAAKAIGFIDMMIDYSSANAGLYHGDFLATAETPLAFNRIKLHSPTSEIFFFFLKNFIAVR
ncbi:enoyl-[acyl-carrier-protein] reductase [NADH] 1, chloroplastic-like [Magnolia sinica]|uniref:enoyl-[acyl-carrier-protein] reductase [NADH] 1, chloroplastic-like n=1 Tax=Magnolia sinica TaxID=86752 RepID=UPI002658C2EF|nr:enoyl-[acyl-carrier-protein] reductase [NADH] 1, chloroplastic-like [Magnolia sinica]